jgi:hypothetical protein
MNTTEKLYAAIFGVLFVGALYAFYHSRRIIEENVFMDKHLLKRGMDKPVIWLYYDTGDVNSRYYMDFGARSSRALNMPFMNLCYETIVAQNSAEYRIEVITGLAGLAALLGHNAMPSGLQNYAAFVNEAEINWIRTAVLAKFGGLWIDPHTVCLRPFGPLPKDRVVFYGTDLNETYAGAEGTAIPGFRCIWSPRPEHPLFKEWEEICHARLEAKGGGQQIRRDANWDWVALSSKYSGIQVDFAAEGLRKKGGKRVELEDLLSTGHEGKLPFAVANYTIFISLPWPELRDRELFGWFLRMSEDQILESDLAVRYLFNKGLTVPISPISQISQVPSSSMTHL